MFPLASMTWLPNEPHLLSIILILLLASTVQGIIGFGFGLVSMSLLVLVIDLQRAVPLVAAFAILVQILLLLKLWKHIYWSHTRPMLGGAIFGAPIGVFLLKEIDPTILLFVLGCILITYVSLSLRGIISAQKELHRLWGLLSGFTGGILGGALNTSGPPVVVYTSLQPWNKNQVSGTLQIFFFFATSIQLLTLWMTDLLTTDSLWLNLKLSPIVFIGVLIGFSIYKRLNQEKFKRWMLFGVFLVGLNLTLRNLPFLS